MVEVSLIDLEAGDLQRLGKRNVAVAACLMCRRAQSFNEVLQLGQVSHLPRRHMPKAIGVVHC